MLRVRILSTLSVYFAFNTLAIASGFFLPGHVGPGFAGAGYDLITGEIIVSINGVNNWYIESASSSLSGDAPSHTPIIAGSLPSDSDNVIGETAFSTGTGTNVSLGRVAATNLGYGDLTISWNAGLGEPLQTDIVHSLVGPPSANINGPYVIDLATDPLSIVLDGSNSGDGVLSYVWTVDGLPSFEISTGTNPKLYIPDVLEKFGGVGVYTVNLAITHFNGTNSDSTTITIINSIPEPASLSLMGLGLAIAASIRRRAQQAKQHRI